jgi:hypothetical protein
MAKRTGWDSLSRREKLSAAMYPGLVTDKELLKEMQTIARGEGKKLGTPKLLSNRERGSCSPLGGQAIQERTKR